MDTEAHYWETWDKKDNTAVVHWGVVGQRGEHEEIKSGLISNYRKLIQNEIDRLAIEGYAEIDEEEHTVLLIEYNIDGFGNANDLEKRHKLEERMNETLGWTGLGKCDGGSIGGGTMEVCCLVVDFDIAKQVIENDLKDTTFSNYKIIYDDNE